MTVDRTEIDRILEFWFEDSAENSATFERLNPIWFLNADPTFDGRIKDQFESIIELVFEGHAAAHEDSPTGLLAMIIVLDQFPRNIYRGTPRAFKYDREALRLSLKMIDLKYYKDLSFVERTFTFMPLQHVENLGLQNFGVELTQGQRQVAGDDPILLAAADEALHYAILHRDIVKEFGRFPHRNPILGRESTEAEIAYLNSGPETFGQSPKDENN